MQLSFFDKGDSKNTQNDLIRESFSHKKVSIEIARQHLEEQYKNILQETSLFDRKAVSYQGNKGELVHSWIRYKEGFSAELVEKLINMFEIKAGDTILDPFSGSSTTLLVAKSLGINSVGMEILPNCHLAWDAKAHVNEYNIAELIKVLDLLQKSEPRQTADSFPHLRITGGAFSEEVEHDIIYYKNWITDFGFSNPIHTLWRLLVTSILEEVSYTRKDGQYLRWDYRSSKVIERNKERVAQGRKPIKKLDKGNLPSVKDALIRALHTVISDIKKVQNLPFRQSEQKLIKENVLYVLPNLESDQFAGVITSPPYCNRYDYTRTYALELAYLGVGEKEIRDLRQGLLSCTVENRPKIEELKEFYDSIGQLDRYNMILDVIGNNAALNEINAALQLRWDRGDMNNRGVLRMVKNYFVESTFIFAELFRTCKDGAYVGFVNDNVRYGGEVIPVDLLTTNLAENIGFEPVVVYVLPQRKGNSSQQMGKFGREALRKSITVWRKPNGE